MAKGELSWANAIVIKTPFANLIGIYAIGETMKAMSLKLQQLGYLPYTIKGENDTVRLLTGAFSTKKGAEAQNLDLKSKGIKAQVILR